MDHAAMLECLSADAGLLAVERKRQWLANSHVVTTAKRRLDASPYTALRSIVCDFHEGVLVLRGQVTSYHLKQRAQETVRTLDGVEVVVNAVEVAQRANRTS